ncbi:M24 family metallopeptidase [Candidatus Solincola sp.]|nr:Xaa-Pro peptidase family protein [Actinomycetota bacterium]MDI7253099.1 Xaa-Pro peptidase family protein [Actinomycetota bacterium]
MQDSEYSKHRSRFREAMRERELDGLLVTSLSDVRYLCGFSGSSGLVLLLPRSGWFLTDFRYREQSREEVAGLRTLICEEDFGKGLREILTRSRGGTAPGSARTRDRDVAGCAAGGTSPGAAGSASPRPLRIGYDPRSLTCAELALYRRRLRGLASLVPLKADMQSVRARKSPAEVRAMKKGIRVAEAAFREALRGLGERPTERELALELDFAARRRGAEAAAFETIVAGGARGALVHARPSGSKLTGAVVVDWGVVFEGYCTDCTRTVALGRVPAEIRKVHRLVLEAQERALERIRPGVRAREVDRVAREVLEKAGYGKAFGHGLGHGVGLEVHEMPHLSPRSRDVLEEGMVFTVEPGVYLPGVGGVRVEDMVLVTSSRAEVLTSLPRSLDPSEY